MNKYQQGTLTEACLRFAIRAESALWNRLTKLGIGALKKCYKRLKELEQMEKHLDFFQKWREVDQRTERPIVEQDA